MGKTNSVDSTQAYSFVLKKIDILEKSLKLFNKKDKKVEYDYGISLQISPNPVAKQSLHMMTVEISPKGQNKDVVAIVSLGFIFEISDWDLIVTTDEKGITLPPGLLNLLNAVVIGTTRGVLFSEFRGTQLHDAILPVLDPTKFEREVS